MALHHSLLLLLSVASLPASSARFRSERAGAVVYLTDGSADRVAMLFRSLRSLDFNVNARWHYPVVIFYEVADDDTGSGGESTTPLTAAQQEALQLATKSELIFAPVNFSAYAHAPGASGAPADLWGKSMSYRHMCRFFAGEIARHPALAPFRYYLRLDADTVLLSALSESDVFEDMAANAWRYGHGALQCDWHGVTTGLWELAEAHFSAVQGAPLAPRLQAPFRDGSCGRAPGAAEASYNNRIYYNNFEVVDLAFLRSAQYQAFYGAVDAAGGFYTQRWGDAPVRTLAVQALLPPAAVHHFRGALYWHQGLFGLDWPLLGAGALTLAGLLCVATGFCAAPLVGKIAVARAFPSTALRVVRAWRRAAACTMDALLCISCPPGGGCCSRRAAKRVRAGDGADYSGGGGRSSSSSAVGSSFTAAEPRHSARSTPRAAASVAGSGSGAVRGASATRRSGGAAGGGGGGLAGGAGAAIFGEHVGLLAPPPVIIPIAAVGGVNDTAAAPSADELAAARRAAWRWSARSCAAIAAAAALGLLLSRSRLDDLINGRAAFSSATAAAARRCYSDDLPCLLAAVADPRRRVVLTVASSGVMPLLLNLVASWRRLGGAGSSTGGDASSAAAARHDASAGRAVGAPELASAAAVDNFLVFALDTDSFLELRARGIPVYWDPAPIEQLDAATAPVAASTGSGLPSERATSGALLYGTAEFNALLRHIHVLTHRVLERGYSVFFSDADTVWLANPLDELTWGAEPPWEEEEAKAQGGSDVTTGEKKSSAVTGGAGRVNPVLGHTCGQLRLGDVVSDSGDQVDPALQRRADCPGGTDGQWTYDAIGMYGDVGGLDPGYSYVRATRRSRAHLAAVLAFQATPAAQAMHNQETFNAVLEPWRGVSPQEFGPARLRVALFDPMAVPNGCRLAEALRRGVAPVVVHANCRTGLLAKVSFLARHGFWFVRLWEDAHVNAAACAALAWVALRTARLLARARRSKAAERKDGPR